MSSLLDDVQKQAQMLTLQEKAALAHMLITEIDSSGDGDIEQMWIAESQRRYQAYLKGEVEAVPGDEALSRARNRLTECCFGAIFTRSLIDTIYQFIPNDEHSRLAEESRKNLTMATSITKCAESL